MERKVIVAIVGSLAFGLIAASSSQAQQLVVNEPDFGDDVVVHEALWPAVDDAAATPPEFELVWTMVVSGGGVSSGATALDDPFAPNAQASTTFDLEATIGQPVTGVVAGGSCGSRFELDTNLLESIGGIFDDGFECGDLSAWDGSVPATP